MSIIVPVDVEEGITGFLLGKGNSICISPNGQFCCFLIHKHKLFDTDHDEEPIVVTEIQFIDLSKPNQQTKVFRFEEESCFVAPSVYWINENHLVFLSVEGTSIKQIMFKVNLQEEEFLTKVCERFYVLNNEMEVSLEMRNAPQVMFQGDGYIAWTDRRRERGSSTGLYLIPENPMNSELRLRKFALFMSIRNPVVQANERIQMKLKKYPDSLEIVGPPLVRNNRLLFCISDAGEYSGGYVFFGVFLAVDIEKLIEVKGLNYDPIEIENETSAYSVEEWTSLIDRARYEIYPNHARPVQVGKYLLFEKCITMLSIINMEDLSFSRIRTPRRIHHVILHPFGFPIALHCIFDDTGMKAKVMFGKITGPWKGSSLKDLARRNLMLNDRISQDAKEEYKGVIYQS